MAILTQLGVNQTVWIQLGLFFVSYFFISQFLIKPYKANLNYRKKNTGGSLDEATAITSNVEKLLVEYQGKLKDQNQKAQTIYDSLKSEAHETEDKLVAQARAQGLQLVEETKSKVTSDLTVAKSALKAQIPQLSDAIASRVLGRSLS